MMLKQKGFTLLELLVVIAIISILVAIVLVAIDPVRRVNDATDRVAASNVRATGTLISVCVAERLSENPPLLFEPCADPAGGYAVINGYGTKPADVDLVSGDAGGDNDVCAAQQGSFEHYFVFLHSGGSVEAKDGVLASLLPSDWCP